MLTRLLFIGVCFLAYANSASDSIKRGIHGTAGIFATPLRSVLPGSPVGIGQMYCQPFSITFI